MKLKQPDIINDYSTINDVKNSIVDSVKDSVKDSVWYPVRILIKKIKIKLAKKE